MIAGLARISFLHRCGRDDIVYILGADPILIFIQASLSGLSGFKNTAREVGQEN